MTQTLTQTTWTTPTEAELKEFTATWGNWKERVSTQRSLARFNTRDLWDTYTRGGSATVVGSAMKTAETANKFAPELFFSNDEGRDYFLHYYLHQNARYNLTSDDFAEGFLEILREKGADITIKRVRQWIGNKLADNVFTGYHREMKALQALSLDPYFQPTEQATKEEDERLGIDLLRYSPCFDVEEAYQVKAPSWITKAANLPGSPLLPKLIESHARWRSLGYRRHTYIIIPIEGAKQPPHRLKTLSNILAQHGCDPTIKIINLDGVQYYELTTSPKE